MSTDVSGTSASTGARPSRVHWLLPAGCFLAGCALGAVVVGVGDLGGDDAPVSSAAATATADAGAGTDDDGDTDEAEAPTREASGLYVRVPESCVRTADGATSLVERVDRVVDAVADLQPERLRQTVDDVQEVRDEVQDVADQCRAAAAAGLQDAADGEGEGAASATPSS